jgi:integrase
MGRVLLTEKFVAAAKHVEGKQTEHSDKQVRGLRFRILPSGLKEWSRRYISPSDGSRKRLLLGYYPATSLAAARGRGLEVNAILDAGQNPEIALAENASGAMLVHDLINNYVEKHAKPNLRSARGLERRLRKDVAPLIGAVRLGDLHKRDCNRPIDAIMRRGKPVEATRVFEIMRGMLRWAVARGDLDRSPMEGMRKPAEPVKRTRKLSDDEVHTFWQVLPTALPQSPTVERILKLCLVTGQRLSEVGGMTKAELNFKTSIWRLPPERVKNGCEHEVPLSPLALAIIREAIAAAPADSPYVFPSRTRGGMTAMVVGNTLARVLEPDKDHPLGKLGVAKFTAHDLRRTMISGLAALGVPPIVAGAIANHVTVTRATITLDVYTHYSYAAEKAEAMRLWSDRLTAIIEGGGAKVLPLERERKRQG